MCNIKPSMQRIKYPQTPFMLLGPWWGYITPSNFPILAQKTPFLSGVWPVHCSVSSFIHATLKRVLLSGHLERERVGATIYGSKTTNHRKKAYVGESVPRK